MKKRPLLTIDLSYHTGFLMYGPLWFWFWEVDDDTSTGEVIK